ncbi:MAG: type II secretion system major pseudopilin GspG [Phycisphaeraceae bacterium]|nr:type II secretion system major pseudopilin GspG [Phycisphaeraceae bacterium]
MTSRSRHRRGFNLVEMMVVLVLIGLLAGLVTVNVRSYMVTGRQNAAKAEIRTLANAIETFNTLHGRYPTNDEGLEILTSSGPRQPERLIDRVPLDPWGNPYQYNSPGRNGEPFEIISFGADGRPGGAPGSADAEISSLDLRNE